MLSTDKDPALLAQPGSGFRFPERKSFSPDRETSELRLVIAGWLKQAEAAVTSNIGVQELRDATFRAAELVIALSARELAILQIQQERNREINGQAAAKAQGSPRSRPRKEKAPSVQAESIRAKAESAQ